MKKKAITDTFRKFKPTRLFFKQRSSKKGLPPGTLVHIGERYDHPIRFTVFAYNEEALIEETLATIEDALDLANRSEGIFWLNIDGVHQVEIFEKLGQYFKLHPLLLEDVVNTSQRPKVEDYTDQLYIVLKTLDGSGNGDPPVDLEQLSLILGKNFVISIQERVGDAFDSIRERLRVKKGRIRQSGADYLAYALMDAIVDHYFTVLATIADDIETLEEHFEKEEPDQVIVHVHQLKRMMIVLRKSIWPVSEITSQLLRQETTLIQKETAFFLRDVHDHVLQLIDSMTMFRDILTNITEITVANASNKLNDVMKVLTVIATIFIPLTFIAGVYGMNFRYMPELEWRYGYPVAMGFMIGVGLFLLYLFKRKNWL